MAIIGERLRELRTEQGLTQTDLASKVGVTTTIISNIERGYSGAKSSIIDSLAEYFNVPTDYLLGRTSVRFKSSRKSTVFSERLKRLMDTNHISADDLAEAAGTSNDELQSILSGDTQPGIATMAKISTAIGTTVDYLIGATEYDSSIACEDEQDIVNDYRRMTKTQRRLFMAELEKIMHR